MRITCLFGMRHGDPDPELMAAADNWTMDDNPDWFITECEKARASWGDELAAERIIVIDVPQAEIEAAFDVPVVHATVEA